ncbi:MAG TPA: hypothetical protein VF183_02205, partial [Acidimicrobiales bacterium]
MRPTPDTQVLADATATPPRRNVARWGRRVAVAFVVYLAVAIGTHAMLIGAVLVARAVSDDPRDDFYGIANF